MQALLPFSCASIYTSGINQVFDMDMDKLPLLRWKTNAAMTSFSMGGLLGLTMLPAAFYHIQVFSLCLYILLIAYRFAVVLGASSSLLICKIVSVIGHTILASLLMLQANSTNLDDPVSTQFF
ncbi:umbelliferone 6-dimethylallyltransferase, chloroplastic-like isoform X1 [Apium graveolens]|uniref:umbelliferone 6-dimethylallyltransferase, chloroplastic-like isoform X1 n=1 Tax=Apium graveolens TaxID=4045 RepID=UPI003D7C0D9F